MAVDDASADVTRQAQAASPSKFRAGWAKKKVAVMAVENQGEQCLDHGQRHGGRLGLALMASISAKDAVAQFDSTTDALCLFIALGFLAPLRSATGRPNTRIGRA